MLAPNKNKSSTSAWSSSFDLGECGYVQIYWTELHNITFIHDFMSVCLPLPAFDF